MKLVIASTNEGKVAEIAALLPPGCEAWKLDDFPDAPIVLEDAETFDGNAKKKAHEIAQALGEICLADDSGLLVDALDGAPGVRSARYGPTDPERIARLLRELKDVPEAARTARFVCSMCLAWPSGREELATGVCEGRIVLVPRGSHGFGYDPVFALPDGRTLAELTRDEKAAVSHRGQALRALAPVLRQLVR